MKVFSYVLRSLANKGLKCQLWRGGELIGTAELRTDEFYYYVGVYKFNADEVIEFSTNKTCTQISLNY